METYIKIGSFFYDYKHCKGIFARSKLTLDAIRTRDADFCNLPDDTRVDTSPNFSNQKIKLLEKVTIDDFEPSQQTISLILNLGWTGIQCVVQKALLMSEQKIISADWVTGLEGGDCHGQLRCDYQIEHQPSHSGGVLNRDMRSMREQQVYQLY
jgi:hypothetical protein